MKHVTVFTTLALLCATLTTAIPPSILSKRTYHRIADGHLAICDRQDARRHYTRADAIEAATSAHSRLRGALRRGEKLVDILRTREKFPLIYLGGEIDGYEAPFMVYPIESGITYETEDQDEDDIEENPVDLAILDKNFMVARVSDAQTGKICPIINMADYSS